MSHDRDRVAVGFAAASGTTACTGNGVISVAAPSETIAHDGNNRNDGDNRDNGDGAAVSVSEASGTTAAVTTSQGSVIPVMQSCLCKHILRKKRGLCIGHCGGGLISLVVGLVRLLLIIN
jgi:hypothetical protein